ncbi:hypothetical protein EAF04_009327 [Stromatinia cepivora]|nr:hypothetical protein EAF04_009327 [Stromatinia cepivora]
MVQSFFTFFSFLVCVNSALIPSPLLNRDDTPSSIAPAPSLPSCAISCIASAVALETKCGASDLACQCDPDNASLIQGAATSCVLGACGSEEALQVLDDATAECSSVLAAGSASASAVPSSVVPSVVPSAAPTSTPASTLAVPSAIPTASPLNSGSPSTAPSPLPSSAAPSSIPSSTPNTSPNATFIIPACARECIQNAIKYTDCALTNLACQCDTKNAGVIQSATANCVVGSCGDQGDWIAVDVQRGQIDNCTALSAPAGSNSSFALSSITGPATANAPTQISLTGKPSGVSTTVHPCGPPIPDSSTVSTGSSPSSSDPSDPGNPASSTNPGGSSPTDPSGGGVNGPSYYSYPSESNPTDPPSSPTSSGGDPPGGSASTPTDPSSPTSNGSSTPTDPGSASSTNASVDPSGSSGSSPTTPGSFPSSSSSNLTDPPGSTDPSRAASSTYPGDPSGASSTPPVGDGNGGSPSYGPGYGGYYPSSTPTTTGSGGDPSNPSSGDSASVSSSATGPASSSNPSTSGGNSESPSTTGGDPSSPSTSGSNSSSPSTTGGDPSSPTTSGDPENPSSFPSGTNPSSTTSPNNPAPPPPGYYGYGPSPSPSPPSPSASATFTSPSTPALPSTSTSSDSSSSPPFRLTLLPSQCTLLTYIMRVYFNLSPPSPYISSGGLTTNDRSAACVFVITSSGLLACESSSPQKIPESTHSSNKTPNELTYFGDRFSKVWESGYTVLSTRNKLSDMATKDLNGTLVVDTTSEYPYGSLLRLVNGEFLGNGNQARFCTQTQTAYTSSSNSDTQIDAFKEGVPLRAYINGTQNLPIDCKEVKLVVEWVDNEGVGETPGYA